MMQPNADILEFLFATVATIVATITGLIGAFSTFRLQNITTEIQLLKGLLLEKKLDGGRVVNDYIKGENYPMLEKIYDRDLDSLLTLEQIIRTNNLHLQLNELLIDTENIRRSQLLHNRIKQSTMNGFVISLIFVFLSITLLIFTNFILSAGSLLWPILGGYMLLFATVLFIFFLQLKQMI